jgi:hypothetical protein
MKQLLAPILVILAFSSIAQIGAKTQQNKLQGVWQNTSAGYQMTLILNADGTGEFDGQSIKYTTEGSTFSITVLDRAQTTMYKYTLLGNSFTVSGGDLQSPLTFVRTTSSNQSTQNNPVPSGMDKNLIGLWTGNGETIEFTASSQCKYMGQIYPYQLSNGFITLQTGQGNLMMGYSIQGAVLSLTVNGQTLQYTKSTGEAAQGLGQVTGGKKYIAQELVGKWCYVNVTNTNSGGSMSEQCITLNADGSYEYYGESSRSVNTNSYYGGTSSQSSDRGTWSYDGIRIYYTSSMNGGSGSYVLEKRNHPKNNDPMIVLDGNTYVTFYQKAPWR